MGKQVSLAGVTAAACCALAAGGALVIAPVAQAAISGSGGFFQGNGSADAVAALQESKYASYTDMGAEGDATSLENVEQSLQFIKECNAIRRAEGVPELKVTDVMMAYAQSDANWSDSHQAHAKQFQVNENIAWGYGFEPYRYGDSTNASSIWTKVSNPFNCWYDEEKANYEAGNGGETGHYKNIVSLSYNVTGFAVSTHDYLECQQHKVAPCHVQVFGTAAKGERTYTIDEYEQLLDVYLGKADASMTVTMGGRAPLAASIAGESAPSQVIVSARRVTAAKVRGAIGDGRAVTRVVLGPKVRAISRRAFASSKTVRTLVVKTKRLKKSAVKGAFADSKVRKVRVAVGSKKTDKRYAKRYRKIFTKKNCGSKVAVVY